MTLRFKQIYYFAFIALVFTLTTSTFAQTRAYRVSDRQVKTLINRIETKTNTFRQSIDRSLDNSNINGTNREDNINSFVENFENSTNSLKDNFNVNRSTNNDVQEVLNRAVLINRFMQNNSLNRTTQNQWKSIRTDLNTLANYYRVSWNWNNQNNQNYPNNNQNNSFDSRITGTYRLNTSQSDNVTNTIERAISNISYNDNQRQRVQSNLERRLISPEMMMIEKRGQQITLASSMVSQVSLIADGVTRSETSENGRMVKVRVSSNNSNVSITYEGDRMNDYFVSFTPINNNQLRISRRVYLENRNETVTIASVYDKTDRTPNWNTNYPTSSNNNHNNNNVNNVNNFIVPNNTRMMATLDSALSTKTAQNNDKFTMTVNFPSQYSGAIIEGRIIGERSGVVSGRATLSLNFETIRLRNGNTYRFAGIVEQVRQPNGNSVDVNNEGTVRDGSQTTKTATRAGAGAILGAIIGAIAGGGQGAAIGAGIGAGAGAGSVVLQGRDNLDLASGSEFTITATAPGNLANNQ
ncbi:MAG TPA: hypothetical protein PKY82_18855 [Pyrinomonadaceae bacterium]|nr:hypothetical protein [Pyrinomonadaceae bacterium]